MDLLNRTNKILCISMLDALAHNLFMQEYEVDNPIKSAVEAQVKIAQELGLISEEKPMKIYWDEAGFVGESKCKQPKRKENNDWRNRGKRGFSGYQSSNFD